MCERLVAAPDPAAYISKIAGRRRTMPEAHAAEPILIQVVSDVVCPWCYIGKRRLEKALAMRPEIPVEVQWHPFLLNPWVPREGMSREDYLTAKFGSVERYNQFIPRMVEAAQGEGLVYAHNKISRQPNTIDCHRLIGFAGAAAGPTKQRLMELYFTEGADLTKRDVLVGAAVDCGLDAEAARAFLDSDLGVAEVERSANSAQQAGIEGVPFFIFGGALAVSGAQAPEYLADALLRATAALSARETAPAMG